ncbi:MAG: hypothetical protein WAU82_00325 [Candidatus Binatus sp.]|uniref:hypothetical protein n=1 Tax=Candidatus Binatus sp. TaxID=2811406 RepID=UPI003BB0A113
MGGSASRSMTAICSAFLMGLLASSSSAVAGGNCQTKLLGKSFACNLKLSNGPPTTDCFEFTSGTSQNFNFFDDTFGNFGCACDTTGSFNSPKFDSSSDAFECVDDSGTQINGKIKGKKISGQGTDIDGNSLIYTCTVGPSCG